MMAEKTGMILNTRDFDIKFTKIVGKQIPEAAASGGYKAASVVIRDAIMEEPRAPHKTGNLWRSQKIERPRIESGEITEELGFDTEYAAAVHEMPSNYQFTLPGSGPKYLESKLIKNMAKYIAIIAEAIKEAGGG